MSVDDLTRTWAHPLDFFFSDHSAAHDHYVPEPRKNSRPVVPNIRWTSILSLTTYLPVKLLAARYFQALLWKGQSWPTLSAEPLLSLHGLPLGGFVFSVPSPLRYSSCFSGSPGLGPERGEYDRYFDLPEFCRFPKTFVQFADHSPACMHAHPSLDATHPP